MLSSSFPFGAVPRSHLSRIALVAACNCLRTSRTKNILTQKRFVASRGRTTLKSTANNENNKNSFHFSRLRRIKQKTPSIKLLKFRRECEMAVMCPSPFHVTNWPDVSSMFSFSLNAKQQFCGSIVMSVLTCQQALFVPFNAFRCGQV